LKIFCPVSGGKSKEMDLLDIERLYSKTNTFYYSYGNRLESSGTFEVTDDLKLKLGSPTGLGQELDVRKVGLEYRIFSTVDNFNYVFRPCTGRKRVPGARAGSGRGRRCRELIPVHRNAEKAGSSSGPRSKRGGTGKKNQYRSAPGQ
jgi:hypothetical protein